MTSPLDDLLDLSLGAAFGRDEPAADAEPLPARIGRYEIRMRLGRGGLGTVYLGHDDTLGREVAIKVLHRELRVDGALLQQFRDEAETSSQLQHPGIVPVHEFGTTDDGLVYYTMRVVAGDTLRQLLARSSSTDGDRHRLLGILERTAQAVAFAHSRGVVHGDLTPANVMVGEFGEVQVLDWGQSRRTGAAAARNRTIGTPAYMAPEQARGDGASVDRRTDVFGLGAMLCEILTGAPPYVGDSVFQVHQRAAEGALDDAARRLGQLTVDRELASLARTCLAARPDDRAQDASVVAHRLAAHLLDVQQRAHRFEIEAAEQQARAAAERRARRATTLLATVTVAAILLAVTSWLWWRSDVQQRRERANERAVAALASARQLREQGDDEKILGEAAAALVVAEAAANAADVDPEHRAAAQALRRDVEQALATAAADGEIRQLLADRRWHLGDDRSASQIEADYRDSFARCGITIGDGDDDAALSALRAHRLRLDLSSALHWWALQRRNAGGPTDDGWRRLLDLADRADVDATRTDLRRAFVGGDVDHLRTLAATPSALELGPDTLGLLGRFLAASGQRRAAIDLLRRAQLRYTDDYALCHELATLLIREPDTKMQDVSALMTTGAALRPDNPHALVDLALALLEERRFEDARPVVARAVQVGPSYSRSWFVASRLREHDGDFAGAIDAARQYVRLEPPGAHALLVLACCLERCGHANEGLLRCREAAAASPRWIEGQVTLARMLFGRGDLAEGIEVMQKAGPLGAGNSLAYALLGSALQRVGLRQQALAAATEGVQASPNNPHVLLQLGLVQEAVGRFDEAVASLTRSHELGQRSQGWPYDSATLVSRARTRRDVVPAARAFVERGDVPASDEELVVDVLLAQDENLAAARLCRTLCAEAPDRRAQLGDRWARAAARSAFLDEPDASTAAERDLCAREAPQVFRERLVHAERAAQQADGADRWVRLRITLSAYDAGPEWLAARQQVSALPPAERTAWQELAADVERLRAAAR